MKLTFLLLAFAVTFSSALGQSYSSVVEVVTVYSQNEVFYLKSWPFDNESPSLRGETKVYRKGESEPIYSLDRGFDSVDDGSNNLILSNDGRVIFYLIPWGADEETPGLKSISIYKDGKLAQSYTESEVTGCDLKKDRCDLVYRNWPRVIDEEKSRVGTSSYKPVFKSGVSEEDKFLYSYALFSYDDNFYLTDSRKYTHQFSLAEAKRVQTQRFDEVFTVLRSRARNTKVAFEKFEAPSYTELPPIVTGGTAEAALGTALKMKATESYGTDFDKFRNYRFKVSGYLSQNGRYDVVSIENFDGLSEAAIREFFSMSKFNVTAIPLPIKKWWIEKYFYFRNANDRLAIEERKLQLKEEAIALKKRLVAEQIDGRYIPKDLGEAFAELDKSLSEIDRKEMSELPKRSDMIQYHMGLGMWLRNNWGLWGGSRLQKYFTDKGMTHPDDMSSVILFYYWDWLKGDKEKWKEWERDPTQKLFSDN